eukprot:CAMPEP_0175259732 /NCGR_PEP_ID=MMETSP0093-20121207/39887_1 /TAXON_ID=311494 /ORGANISM="Alexandrium monilatum, Strain CCMP3105" /LENGTH=208 /DNA_ID=CAMNT_0016554151 /DNA_START=165 /DNA_END=789 /DNA_ORIENTATION=-
MAHNACVCGGGSRPRTWPPPPATPVGELNCCCETLGVVNVCGDRHHEGRWCLAAATDLVVAAATAADADLRARRASDLPHLATAAADQPGHQVETGRLHVPLRPCAACLALSPHAGAREWRCPAAVADHAAASPEEVGAAAARACQCPTASPAERAGTRPRELRLATAWGMLAEATLQPLPGRPAALPPHPRPAPPAHARGTRVPGAP